MAAAHIPEQFFLESDELQEGDDDQYQTVMSPKENRRLKRKRLGSPLIEILTHSNQNSSDDSDNPETTFQTPMKQSEKPKPQPPDLKILLAPIDKTKISEALVP